MFLQIVDKALEANPWNSLGYGILVSVLIVAIGVLWLELQREKKSNKELFEKSMQMMAKLTAAVEGDKKLSESVNELLIQIRISRESANERVAFLQVVEQKVDEIYLRLKEATKQKEDGS